MDDTTSNDARGERPYRVIQWATGNIGLRSLRAVIEHPRMELVGLHVHSDDKAGRDAGELCGSGATGVLASQSVDEILALDADCVLYMPQGTDFDVLCRILESGKNVVTTRGDFHRPANLDADTRARIEAACQRGGSSIHSTGSSPGFISEAVPLVLTSVQRRLDRLTINEFADVSSRNSPELLFDIMRFGSDPGIFDERWFSFGRASFGPSLELVADALGIPLDSVESGGSVAIATEPTEIAAGTVPAGGVGALRLEVTGLRHGKPTVCFTASWYCVKNIEPAWDLRATGWHILVEGDTPLDVDIHFPVPDETYASVSPGYTAHRAVNAVPVVCAAAPGIRTTVELPQVVAFLG